MAAGIVTIVACLGLYFIPGLSDTAFAVACAVVALGSLAVAVALSFLFLHRLGNGRDA